MKFLGVIPARYASTRLEGKPLAKIGNNTMIEWVYKRALSSNLDMVVVATDDEKVYNEVKSFGGEVMMTSKNHPNGTSRIAEVAKEYSDYDIIINIQGDEPLIQKEMINSLMAPFKEEKNLEMATLKHKMENMEEVENPNNVKVITSQDDYAIYFSRSVIPYPRELDLNNYFKHVGIYGYKRDFVIKYSEMKPTALEVSESLEQLRAIENGYRIKVLETPYKIVGVDTKEDLERVRKIVEEENLSLENL